MAKQQFLAACAFSALAFACASPASAQVGGDAAAPQVPANTAGVQPVQTATDTQTTERDIVVTGSLIRGTPEDAALPVDVIGGEELTKQGNPSPIELLKALPTSSGVLGDSNQFDSRAQGAEGIATVNLRGLSPQRTLVLLNSKRLTTAGNGIAAVDINLLPLAAIGRIEVLKDGAAATYGSDAVAGVVNFITRTDQEGFQAAGSYKFVKSTDGDIDGSLSYGHHGDGFRFLAAVGFQKRGELLAKNRAFAVQPFLNNPQGGWTGGGNPATFLGLAATGAPVTGLQADTSCAPLGGYVTAQNRCATQYSAYDALVDLEKRGQAFIDFEADVAPDTKFELTALYGRSTVPHGLTSPSYILTQAPSLVALGGTNPTPFVSGFYVPASNPGFVAYRAANPTVFPATATGAVFPLLLFRPFLAGGDPATLGDTNEPGSARAMRKSERFRVTGELRGRITDGIEYNLSATYDDYSRYSQGYDEFGDRVELALRGLGGFNCTGTTPGANGCQYLNPFGNAVVQNAATGAVNPQGSTGLANSADLTNWLFVPSYSLTDTELYVAEGSISGSTGLHLPGGDVKFGFGGQYRYTWFDVQYSANANIAVNPCRETPINGNTNAAACAPSTVGGAPAAPNGAYGFLGTGRNNTLHGGVYAGFGELQLPVFDRFNVQAAARYENYGGLTGSTFNPEVRGKLDITNWLGVRAGIGTTFRGPQLTNLDPNRVTALQLIGSSFRPVDVFGNAALKPEKSTNYSGGVLLHAGRFSASADYFHYKIRQVIISDPLAAMVATLFPVSGGNTCAANPGLAARFTFNTGACTAATTNANVSRVTTFLQNAGTQTSSGIDVLINWRGTFGGVRVGAGATGTYNIDDRISDIIVAGTVVQPGFNGVGLLNYQNTLYPLPKYKAQAYFDLGGGPLDARFTVNYVDKLHDQRLEARTGPFAPDCALGHGYSALPNAAVGFAGTACNAGDPVQLAPTLLTGADIRRFISADVNVQLQLPHDVVLSGTVVNVFDAQPPFARTDYNYDPFTSSALGRQFKVGLSTKF